MSTDFVMKGIKDFLHHGINLNLESIEEEEEYLSVFMDWFAQNTEWFCCPLENSSCIIETKHGVAMCEVFIENSVMRITPHNEDLFGVITDILRFVAKKHESFIDSFRGKEQGSKILDPEELKNVGTSKSYEEESTEEDEWL